MFIKNSNKSLPSNKIILEEVKTMVNRKIAIVLIISTIVLLTGVLIPGLLIGANNDSPTATRLYADNLAGPWSATSSATTRYVQTITVVNGQTSIYIKEVYFMKEAPSGTNVFFTGIKGETGPQGPQGPQGLPGEYLG